SPISTRRPLKTLKTLRADGAHQSRNALSSISPTSPRHARRLVIIKISHRELQWFTATLNELHVMQLTFLPVCKEVDHQLAGLLIKGGIYDAKRLISSCKLEY